MEFSAVEFYTVDNMHRHNGETDTMANTNAAKDKMGDFENFQDFDVDESFAVSTGDVIGYWDPEKSACMCIPRGVKIFDGNIDDRRPAMLLVCEATRNGIVIQRRDSKEDDWEHARTKKGDMIGVWYKPGMRGILNRGGVECKILLTDKEIDTGKPNPMPVYEVKAARVGTSIPVLEDSRVESRHAKTPFTTGGGSKSPSGHDNSDADDLDENIS